MPICSFYTAKFTQCTNNPRHAHHVYCGVHAAKADRMGQQPDGCPCVVGDHWCGRPIQEGHRICETHVRRREALANREAERVNMRGAMMRLTDEYMLQNPLPVWTQVVDDLQARMNLPAGAQGHVERLTAYAAARRFFILTTPAELPIAVLMHYWVGEPLDGLGVGLPAPAAPVAPVAPVGQLGRLAVDAQNVHTAVVAKQTNDNLDLLLEATPSTPGDTLMILTRWWMFRPKPLFEDYWRVMEDVRHWYGKRTCRKTNDSLYKRVLDGLVEKILTATDEGTKETDELFEELVKRLWEECSESVGMCCDGHLSRLANVLVGFDEAFRPPVAVGEILQQKMAAIAELKLSPRHKLQRAMEVMEELKVPIEERAPWLEALEE